MNKNVLFNVLNACALLIAALLWVLSLLIEEFAWYNLGYGIALVCAVLGLTFVLGVNKRLNVLERKAKVLLAVSFWIIGAVAIVFAISLPASFIPALICLVIAVAIVISVIVTGGEKWDKGDNQKPGYKNYYERKEESNEGSEASAEDLNKK